MTRWLRAARSIKEHPGIPALTSVILGLGIAAVTTTAALLDDAFFRKLPVQTPDELFVVGSGAHRGVGRGAIPSADLLSYEDFRSLRRSNDGFREVAAIGSFDIPLLIRRASSTDAVSRETASARLVSGDYFELFGAKPVVGRLLRPEDETRGARAHVAVLSYAYWSKALGARADVVGTVIATATVALRIVGVASSGFTGETWGRPPDVWVPITLQETLDLNPPRLDDPEISWIIAIGRLRQHLSPAAGQARVNAALHQAFAARFSGSHVSRLRMAEVASLTIPLTPGGRGLVSGAESIGSMTSTIIVFELFTIVPVGMLVVDLWRRRSQPAREWVLVTAASAPVAVLGVGWLSRALTPALASAFGLQVSLARDARLWLTGCLVFVAVAGLLGLILRVALRHPAEPPSTAPKRPSWWPPVSIAVRAAPAIAVFYGAILLNESLHRLQHFNTGADGTQVVMAAVHIPTKDEPRQRIVERYQALSEAAGTMTGADGAALASSMVASPNQARTFVMVDGARIDDKRASPTLVTVTTGFFHSLGVPVLMGRDFASGDIEDHPAVAVINQRFVEMNFGNRPVLGTSIRVGSNQLKIIGVVGDVAHAAIRADQPAVVYVPLSLSEQTAMPALYVRLADRSAGIGSTVDRLRATADRFDVWVRWMRTLDEHVRQAAAPERLLVTLAWFGAAISTLAALVGVCLTRRSAPASLLETFAIAAPLSTALSIGLRRSFGPTLFDVRGADWLVLGALTVGAVLLTMSAAIAPRWLRTGEGDPPIQHGQRQHVV